MVTQSWCSGLCLASFSSLTSDLYYFYYSVSNGLFLLLQRLVTARSPKEDLADSSATNIYHRYTTLQLSVAIFEMFTLDKCVFQASKTAWKNIARCRGERTAWRIHCIYRNGTATFNHVASPQLGEEFGVNVSWTQWGVAGLCIRCLWSKQVAEPRTCC